MVIASIVLEFLKALLGKKGTVNINVLGKQTVIADSKIDQPMPQKTTAKEAAKPEASSKQNRKGLLHLSDEVKKYLD